MFGIAPEDLAHIQGEGFRDEVKEHNECIQFCNAFFWTCWYEEKLHGKAIDIKDTMPEIMIDYIRSENLIEFRRDYIDSKPYIFIDWGSLLEMRDIIIQTNLPDASCASID